MREFQLFDEYQEAAATTAKIIKKIPPDVYTALGLNGEAGEVAEKIKKFYRDDGDFEATRLEVRKELGDALWYLSETARHWGLLLSDVALGNLEKLRDRRDRGVISGNDRHPKATYQVRGVVSAELPQEPLVLESDEGASTPQEVVERLIDSIDLSQPESTPSL